MESRCIHNEQFCGKITVIFEYNLNLKMFLPIDEAFAWNNMKDLCVGHFDLEKWVIVP